MKRDSIIVTIAVVAVLASFVGLLMNYGSLSNFNNLFTGFAVDTEEGTVNVTITTQTSINITSANGTAGSKALNWGTGTFTTAGQPAYLISNGTLVNSNGWDQVDSGFIIENIGNTNVNLTVKASSNAATFIGIGAEFQYNLTDSEAGSCVGGLTAAGVYTEFTTSDVTVCSNFTAAEASDELRMDILLMVPSTATGSKETTVVLSYEEN